MFLKEQMAAVEQERKGELRRGEQPDLEKVEVLQKLRGIGPVGSWVLVREMFGWRRFRNRRQVASLAGLTPTPFNSGTSTQEQGISKAGNRRIRAVAIELAWGWVRFQPDSALTRWYIERFERGGKRARKVGIVALARRLLIELWRFLETGVLPEGAQLKAQA
jgi:transposase